MKKTLFSVAILSLSVFGVAGVAGAQTATSTDPAVLQAQIQQLLQQVVELKAQIAELKNSNMGLQGDVSQMKQALQLHSRLRIGMRGNDVKRLQEILATDPNVLSDANVTGFFGPITEHAVKHFQKHFGLDTAGEVGPKTLNKLNELLKEKDVNEQDLSDGTDGDLGDLGDANDDVNDGEQGQHDSAMENASSTSQHEDDAKGDKHGEN